MAWSFDSTPLRIASVLLIAAMLVAFPASAQLSATGEIHGRVVDDARLPVEGASVVLQRLAVESLADSEPAVVETRAVVTGVDGAYRFENLPRAQYRIRVSRLGFTARTLEVDLRNVGGPSDLSIGLAASPVSLPTLQVDAGPPEPYGRNQPASATTAEGQMLLDRRGRERHLVSDTRELTHADVLAAVTLAETDLFRALQRVPGVTTRDDYTATMWTRGASWDQTRVYFDGLPLYNPTHAGWLFAAVNPDAIGAASFYPGYRSARWGEGSAGVLDLQSRTGRRGKSLHGNSEISLASARLAFDGELPRGITWVLAARRSYVDVISALADGIAGRDDLHIPYDFTDFVSRVDVPVGRGWIVEGSSILEYDNLRGNITGLLEGNRGRWGNRVVRVGASGPVGPLVGRVSVGGTDFSTLIFENPTTQSNVATLPTLENAIRHRSISLELGPGAGSPDGGNWAVGFQSVRDSVSYDGPFSLLGALISGGTRDPLVETPFTYGSALSHSSVWGERRWTWGNFSALTGLRVEFGDSVANGGITRLAPRAALRSEPRSGIAFTAGWSRGYQYTQDVSPAAGPIGPQLHLSAIWVLASPAQAFPAIRTDLATLGAEHYWGDGWSVVANVYDRRATGLKIPNPIPGAVSIGRDPDAEASNHAQGMEFTLRRLSSRWSGSIGYSRGFSDMSSQPRDPEAEQLDFPSSADIRSGLDASILVRLSQEFRIGSAFTFGSGVPYTRLIIGDGGETTAPLLGAPNGERTPNYASFDLMAEYERPLGDWRVGAYVQIRNIANRNNSVTYSGSWDCPVDGSLPDSSPFAGVCSGGSGVRDKFEPGLPRLPLIGFRVAF